MKRFLKLLTLLLVVAIIPMMTGCGEKREELKFDGEEGSITFKVPVSGKYKISTNKDDLRTSREQGVLIGDGFKIGIEFDDNYKYFYGSSLDELIKTKKDNTDFKEVTYSGVKGVQYFYGGYNCYDIILPVKNNEKYLLNLSVYGKEDNESSAKEAIADKAVKDVLDHMTFSAK